MQWHRELNTRDLPWKGETDPYRIWLSEIILQQTRAEQGRPYYERFTSSYPDVHALAAASEQQAFKHWEGLGYYARCRNMLKTAREVSENLSGTFPASYEGLLALPGVGPYTAAAIASFAFGLPHAVLDGNVYRVLARYFGIMHPTDGTAGKALFQALADAVLDQDAPAGYNQAIMDFGATVCTPAAPACSSCPVSGRCVALRAGLVAELPLRAKKAPLRQRWFHYLVVRFEDEVWIRQRRGKDIWNGLYEPYLFEAEAALDRQELPPETLPTGVTTAAFGGAVSQKLSHQQINSRFFVLDCAVRPAMPPDGAWVAGAALSTFAFPKSVLNFFEKNGYF
jgi:A/G-specific adenine glycosylase